MRILILTLFLGVLYSSCTEDGITINTLACQAIVTYNGIDECYIMPSFTTEKGEIIAPVNMDYFIAAGELTPATEYQIGYSPIDDLLDRIGQCAETEVIQAVRFNCFKEL